MQVGLNAAYKGVLKSGRNYPTIAFDSNSTSFVSFSQQKYNKNIIIIEQQTMALLKLFEQDLFKALKHATLYPSMGHKESTEQYTLGIEDDLLTNDRFFLEELVAESAVIDNEAYMSFKSSIENTKYPMRPFYKTIARNLFTHIASIKSITTTSETGSADLGLNILNHDFKDTTKSVFQKLSVSFEKDEDNSEELLKELIEDLRKSDILVLMGLGRTEGSLNVLPPDLYTIWNSFQQNHHPKSKLTVGARALTKHSHRSSELFWGVCTGKEETKNAHALEILVKIINDCSWINIHTLPHQTYVLEMRSSAGYGLRWKHDGAVFRGFLEPQMENGHEMGWKH